MVSGLPHIFSQLYDCAWFVGVAVSSAVYTLLMRGAPGAYQGGAEEPLGGGPGGLTPAPGGTSA